MASLTLLAPQQKEDKPLKSIPVHDYLKTKLCDLYENDCIFDKFECTVSSNANYLLTGACGCLCAVVPLHHAPCLQAATASTSLCTTS